MKKCIFILASFFCVFLMTKNTQASFTTVDCTDAGHLAILGIPQEECEGLEALWDSTNGENWNYSNNWDTLVDIQYWKGIQRVENGHIVALDFEENRLSGYIPLEIGNFVKMQKINFEDNRLSGAIPAQIGQLNDLERIRLSRNKLNSIPSEIGNLYKLEDLDLDRNNFTENILDDICRLQSLKYLDLHDNEFDSIPDCLFNMQTLIKVDISYNKITGNLSNEIGNLENLENLNVSFNKIEGQIPESLTNLNINKLVRLDFRYNNFSKKIPNFAKFIWMDIFDITYNKFVFSDFENEYEIYKNEFENFSYFGQINVDTERKQTFTKGKTLKIAPEVEINPSGNDHYQWYKDGDKIDGVTDRVFVQDNASCSNVGKYTYRITNSVVDDLTLLSNEITVCADGCGCEIDDENDFDDDKSVSSKTEKSYKKYKKKYKNDTAKADYKKIKNLKRGTIEEFALYQEGKNIYKQYKHFSKPERQRLLTQEDYEKYQMYKRYRGYKKYKELRAEVK